MNNDNLDLTNSNLLGEEFSYALGEGEQFSYAKGFRPFGGKGKKILDKAKARAKKIDANIKKKVTKLKDKLGKVGKDFRNRVRGVLRKGILKNISRNVHGMATRLYPAVAPADAISKARFKKPFVAKSKKIYSDLLSKWKKFGGEEKDLKDAIISGSSKGIFKLRRGRIGKTSSTPLKNKFGAEIVYKQGSSKMLIDTNSEEYKRKLASLNTPEMIAKRKANWAKLLQDGAPPLAEGQQSSYNEENLRKLLAGDGRVGSVPMGKSGKSGFDGDEYSNLTDESLLSGLTNMSMLNASGEGENNSDYFYAMISPDVSIYYGEDGSETSAEEGVPNEAGTAEEVPVQEEVQKGNKGFMAWLMGLFKKNKAQENPYEADAPLADKFDADTKEDNKNLPADVEANNDVMKELDNNHSADDAGGATDGSKGYEKTDGDDYLDKSQDGKGDGDGKILGMPKMVAYGVGALLLAVGGFLLYRKMRGKK